MTTITGQAHPPGGTKIYAAIGAVQAEIEPVLKKAKAYKYKYAPYDVVMANLQPLLTEQKLVICQTTHIRDALQMSKTYEGPDDDKEPVKKSLEKVSLAAILRTTVVHHPSGEYIFSEIPLEVDEPQDTGSRMTYYRRYGVVAIFNLVTEDDDDGARGSPRAEAKRRGAPKPKTSTGSAAAALDKKVDEALRDYMLGISADLKSYEAEINDPETDLKIALENLHTMKEDEWAIDTRFAQIPDDAKKKIMARWQQLRNDTTSAIEKKGNTAQAATTDI